MKRRIIAAFAVSAICTTMAADLPDQWRSWRYSRAVQTSQGERLSLPWEMYAHCQPGCQDVRIVNSRGEEVPYVLLGGHADRNIEEHTARVLETSFVADRFTQVIGDLGEKHPAYDQVRIQTERPDFIVWAEVALSDDAKTWRVVEARAPIARFRSRAVDGTQTVPFQGLSSRYLRVRIADPSAQFPVTGISVLNQDPHPETQARDVSATFTKEPSDSTDSVWRAAFSSANQPVSQLRIATGTPEFYRAVRISGSSDGQQWSYFGSGVVYRYSANGKTREMLHIEFPEGTGNRFLRVEMINANDQPLSNLQLSLAAVPRTLLWKHGAGESYRLLYGNEKAVMPQYDLAHYFDLAEAKPAYASLTLGPEEETTNYRDPRPFTERHPELLWSALALAILLIGLTAVKALRSTGDPASPVS